MKIKKWLRKEFKICSVDEKGLIFIVNLFFYIGLITTVEYFMLNLSNWNWDILFVTSYWLLGFGFSILLARFIPFFKIEIKNIEKRT